MYKYAEYCPVTAATEILGDYWMPLIVRELLGGTNHFNDLVRSLPGISRSLLVHRLRRLEAANLVECLRSSSPRSTSYQLTEGGRELQGVIDALSLWGTRWALGEPKPEDLDPAILLWLLRKKVKLEELPPRRVVLQIEIRGVKPGTYWLVLEPAEASLCITHPGFDVDAVIASDLTTLYRIWLGRVSMLDAVRSGAAALEGPPAVAKVLPSWFA